MTFGEIWRLTMNRPKKIDDSNRHEHYYLTPSDKCFYFTDFLIGKQAKHSPGNKLIFNFKKSNSRQNSYDWKYKEEAINEVAMMIWQAYGKHLEPYFLTAIPPSKRKDSPEYDDRALKAISKIQLHAQAEGVHLKAGELLETINPRDPMHSSQTRWTPLIHSNNLSIIGKEQVQDVRGIIIFDDVLITGAQFKGACLCLNKEFPNLPIVGIFIARGIR